MGDVTPESVDAGHAFYTKRSLAIYDLAILGYFSRLAWRCPARRVLEHFDRHVTPNHLDVGVGTGWFLDHCQFGSTSPRIGLMDLSEPCIEKASGRLRRFHPEVYRANALEPLRFDAPGFDSISLNDVLHCLPGTIRTKGAAFAHLRAAANPGAVLFGATLLHDGVHRSWFARKVMDRNNEHGIFHNERDDLDGLRSMLGDHLLEPAIEVVGCVALFSGRL